MVDTVASIRNGSRRSEVLKLQFARFTTEQRLLIFLSAGRRPELSAFLGLPTPCQKLCTQGLWFHSSSSLLTLSLYHTFPARGEFWQLRQEKISNSAQDPIFNFSDDGI
jgi:hypothetical protein